MITLTGIVVSFGLFIVLAVGLASRVFGFERSPLQWLGYGLVLVAVGIAAALVMPGDAAVPLGFAALGLVFATIGFCKKSL